MRWRSSPPSFARSRPRSSTARRSSWTAAGRPARRYGMTETAEGTLLWEPPAELKENAVITRYMRWLTENKDRAFEDYGELWEWSVNDVEGFWSSLWEFLDVKPSKPYEKVLAKKEMPGAEWFPGAELNYAEHAFRNAQPDEPALVHKS